MGEIGMNWAKDAKGDYQRLQFYKGQSNVKQTPTPNFGSTTGYGRQQPTSWMVWMPTTQKDVPRNKGRWQRVHCCIWANAGSTYIIHNGQNVLTDID